MEQENNSPISHIEPTSKTTLPSATEMINIAWQKMVDSSQTVLPIVAITYVLLYLFGALFLPENPLNPYDSTPRGTQDGLYAVFLFITLALYAIIHILALKIYQDKIKDFRSLPAVFRTILPRVLTYLGVTITSSILTLIGFGLLIIPGFILTILLILVHPVAVLEKASVGTSIRRSIELTKSQFWSVAWRLFVAFLFIFLPRVIVSIFDNETISIILSAVYFILTLSFIVAFQHTLYEKLRAIKPQDQV